MSIDEWPTHGTAGDGAWCDSDEQCADPAGPGHRTFFPQRRQCVGLPDAFCRPAHEYVPSRGCFLVDVVDLESHPRSAFECREEAVWGGAEDDLGVVVRVCHRQD